MNRRFSAWRTGAVYYVPLLLIGLAVIAWSLAAGFAAYGWLALLPGLFVLNFFRDPPRAITQDETELVSPADGLVVAIEDLESTPWYEGPCKRVSIFLNIFDVHVNRAPDDCRVQRIAYQEGEYRNAMSAESSEANEANTLWLETPRGAMTVRQIAGLVARRIVCAVGEGGELAKGERFGMIKFGSRTELYLPPHTEILVRDRQRVKGGASVVARIRAHEQN